MKYLALEDILHIHFAIIEEYGGSHGVRDEGRLQSVVQAPQQEVFGQEQYISTCEKAAVYMRNIIGDHPFVDGNKRSGTSIAAVFLDLNGTELTASPKMLEDFAVQVAVDDLDIPAIAEWLEKHSR